MLNDKTVVITGASRGIGLAIAEVCARHGANIVLNYRRSDSESKHQIQQIAGKISDEHGVNAITVNFDVRDKQSIDRALHELYLDRLEIDAWVNNAALNLPGLLLAQTEQSMRDQIDTNVLGTLFCCQSVISHMLEARKGAIVNMGSIASRVVAQGQSVYCASKGAVASLTKALAREYGRKGIRVNCVEPGPVDTDMFKMTKAIKGDEIAARVALGRIGEAREIAETVAYLLSEQASYINGEIITVDGGYSLG